MTTYRLRRAPFAVALTASLTLAQIPDGHFVWGSQQGTAGQNGIYYSHPRDPLVPVGVVGNLPPSLAYSPAGARGCASVLYRRSDGALIAGERAPNGTSVDLHVLHLLGDQVVWAQSFSVGTGIAFGEICQAGLLPDGRIAVAASGLSATSVLAQALTTNYQWQGIGIVDTVGGGVTPVAITNLAQVPGVLNGLAVPSDGLTIFFCNWITNASGGLWSVPLAGGTASQLATLPGGPASLAFDNDGSLVMPLLVPGAAANVYRYDPASALLTAIPTTAGPLNCLAVETVTGNYVVATRETGTPPRSLYWMTPGGTQTLLVSPNLATINGIDVNPDPEVVATGTPGITSYDWVLAPNPGGLPLLGSGFSLTVRSTAASIGPAALLFGTNRYSSPLSLLGAQVHVDLVSAVGTIFWFADEQTFPIPIPSTMTLRGALLYAQTLHDEGVANLAASSLLAMTVL
ncbi:MAG: hypothetical protein WAT39_04035 [Planctomycetota bacterium]